MAPASAQMSGVGTSSTSTKVLTAQLGASGSLLDLTLLNDEARSTVDSAVSAPEAFTRLTALSAKAGLVPSNPINVTQGVFEAKNTGPSEVAISGSTLALPSTIPLAPVLSGTIDPGKLTATLNQGVAASTMNTELSQIKAIGGLLSLGSLKSVLDASSGSTSSAATRGANVTDLTVLDLGALLQGLGLPLSELTPAQLVALVDALGVSKTLGLPTGSTTLAGAIAQLNSLIDQVQGTVVVTGGTVTQVTSVVDSTVAGLLGTVGVTATPPSVTGTAQVVLDEAQALLDQLQALLNDLLSKGLAALNDLALLRLQGVEVGVTTKAVDTVEGSVATVTGKIGKVYVGGIELPGIDLAATAAQVNAAVAAVNTQLGQVLSLVDPGLANVVKVSVLDQASSVVKDGDYVRSRAGVTAASATITPPANLAALVQGIIGQVGVGEKLSAAGAAVPAVDGLMNSLAGALNLATSALTAPAKVQIASVVSASDFRVVAAPGTTPGSPADSPSLPRTGGSDLVLLGGLLGVLALAIRRFVRSPETAAVRIDR